MVDRPIRTVIKAGNTSIFVLNLRLLMLVTKGMVSGSRFRNLIRVKGEHVATSAKNVVQNNEESKVRNRKKKYGGIKCS